VQARHGLPLPDGRVPEHRQRITTVYAYATAGGTDTAFLNDTAGADTFTGRPAYATMIGASLYSYASGFDFVYGCRTSGGAGDTGYLYDTAGNDALAAKPSTPR